MADPCILTELPVVPALNLRGAGEAFHAIVAATTGVAPPTEANRFHVAQGRSMIWLGPDEWLLLGTTDDGDGLEEELQTALKDVPCGITDVTGNRVIYRLAGPQARDLIAAGCSIDLHPRAFGAGQCAQTLIARTGVILLQRDDDPTYDILVRRSFARYLAAWFASVAATAGRP